MKRLTLVLIINLFYSFLLGANEPGDEVITEIYEIETSEAILIEYGDPGVTITAGGKNISENEKSTENKLRTKGKESKAESNSKVAIIPYKKDANSKTKLRITKKTSTRGLISPKFQKGNTGEVGSFKKEVVSTFIMGLFLGLIGYHFHSYYRKNLPFSINMMLKRKKMENIGLSFSIEKLVSGDFSDFEESTFQFIQRLLEKLSSHISNLDAYNDDSKRVLYGQEMAVLMEMKNKEFQDKFKQVFGMKYKAFVNLYRLEMSKEELLKQKFTIANAAFSVGYSPSEYTKQFKSYFGLTPSQYRKSQVTQL